MKLISQTHLLCLSCSFFFACAEDLDVILAHFKVSDQITFRLLLVTTHGNDYSNNYCQGQFSRSANSLLCTCATAFDVNIVALLTVIYSIRIQEGDTMKIDRVSRSFDKSEAKYCTCKLSSELASQLMLGPSCRFKVARLLRKLR